MYVHNMYKNVFPSTKNCCEVSGRDSRNASPATGMYRVVNTTFTSKTLVKVTSISYRFGKPENQFGEISKQRVHTAEQLRDLREVSYVYIIIL